MCIARIGLTIHRFPNDVTCVTLKQLGGKLQQVPYGARRVFSNYFKKYGSERKIEKNIYFSSYNFLSDEIKLKFFASKNSK